MKLVCFCLLFSINSLLISCKLNGEGNVCGRPLGENALEEKIVAGYDVGYYKYPWYAALFTDNIVACGGTLVGSKTIVSAAHCFKEYIVGNALKQVKLEDVYRVVLGIYNRCVKEKTQKTFEVQKVYVHEKYKNNTPYYDISLLILKDSTSGYQPICLPKAVIKNRPKEGSAPGLGTLRYHGSTPCTLHEARLLIYSDLECRKMLNRTGNEPNKLYRAFCAGYLQGGIDTCQGDSGGPFHIADDYGNFILQGLVSFGFHCANPNLLGIYTDVSQYIDWIEEKAGFNATMEGPNNATAATIISDNETAITTENSPKTTKKPHQTHVIHETVVRPLVNIIIIRNKNKEKKTSVAGSEEKIAHRLKHQSKKKKHFKSKKSP